MSLPVKKMATVHHLQFRVNDHGQLMPNLRRQPPRRPDDFVAEPSFRQSIKDGFWRWFDRLFDPT